MSAIPQQGSATEATTMTPETYTPPLISSIQPTFVSIQLGKSGPVFQALKPILCQSSEYFSAALNGDFKENSEHFITLPNVDESTFKSYYDWACQGKLLYDGKPAEEEVASLQQIKLYVFADAILVPALKRQVMDEIRDSLIMPRYHIVTFAFENLPVTSKLCQYILDWYEWSSFTGWLDDSYEEETLEHLSRDFLLHFLRRCRQVEKTRGDCDFWNSRNKCECHDHPDEASKEACPGNQSV